MGFADFKKRHQGNKDSLNKIKSKVEEENGGSYIDERYWNFEVDNSGNGMAIIRFMPEPEGEDMPYISYYEHAFKGKTGKWYINRSLTSLGKGVPDPVAEQNTESWNDGTDEGKAKARARKRHKRYISNIYIIKDSKNPQNEGKVMLWKYGSAIYKMIEDAVNPPAEFDDEPFNPFDFWEGADFKLKAYNNSASGYRSYDKSAFSEPSEFLDGDDEKLEEVYNSLYSLEAENSNDKYKSYDELKKHLDFVDGITNSLDGNSKKKSDPEEDKADEKDDDYEAPLKESTSDDDDDDYMSLLED